MLTANYFHELGGVRDPSKSKRDSKRMWKQLETELSNIGGSVNSRSGWSAAVAVNICVTKGYAYELRADPQGYFLKRVPTIKDQSKQEG